MLYTTMHAHEHAFVLNNNEALQCMLIDKVLLIYLQGVRQLAT